MRNLSSLASRAEFGRTTPSDSDFQQTQRKSTQTNLAWACKAVWVFSCHTTTHKHKRYTWNYMTWRMSAQNMYIRTQQRCIHKPHCWCQLLRLAASEPWLRHREHMRTSEGSFPARHTKDQSHWACTRHIFWLWSNEGMQLDNMQHFN